MNKKKIISAVCVLFIIIIAIVSVVIFMSGNKNDNKKWSSLKLEGSLKLDYANQFSVDYYEGGYSLITIAGQDRFLIVPEDGEVPAGIDEDMSIIKQPVSNIYLAATSAMDLFRAIDSIDSVKMSGSEADDWYVEEAREAMEKGTMIYAGKYNAPDYETILSNDCHIAIESTMITHSPEVKEKLEQLGIPVLVEHSSYESHPLGRLEWIKMYGELLGKQEEASNYFQTEKQKVENILSDENPERTVAFFYVNSNGAVNVRKSSDYVAKMIELAGGKYIFDDIESDNALSTVNMQMESFYARAKDADYIIYNSAIDSELYTLDDLFKKSELFRDFKAVRDNNVFCTGKSTFQETTGVSDLIVDMHEIITNENVEDSDLKYIHRLQASQ